MNTFIVHRERRSDKEAEHWIHDPNFCKFANLNTLGFDISKEIDWKFDLSVIIFTSKRSLLPRMLLLSNGGQITLSGNVTCSTLGCLRNKHPHNYFKKGCLLAYIWQEHFWYHFKSKQHRSRTELRLYYDKIVVM